MSKVLQAIELYNNLVVEGVISADRKDRKNRAPVIRAFKEQLGLTNNGASTYYGNIQRQLKGWTLETYKAKNSKVVKPTVDHVAEARAVVGEMTIKQLVELYNVSQKDTIKKFRDKAVGVKKVVETYGENLPQVLAAMG